MKELRIRLSVFKDEEARVKICKAIQIFGRLAEDDDCFEYMQPMYFKCTECNDIHAIYILIN